MEILAYSITAETLEYHCQYSPKGLSLSGPQHRAVLEITKLDVTQATQP